MVQINKFFFGWSLQTGTLIILWTTLILSSASAFIDISRMSEESQILSQEHSENNFTSKSYIALIYKISVIVISIIGLYGITKNKSQFLVAFYYFNYMQLFLISVFILYLFFNPINTSKAVFSETKQEFDDFTKVTLLILFLLFGLALQIYLIVVVKNYYEIMKERSTSAKSPIFIFTYPEYHNYGFI